MKKNIYTSLILANFLAVAQADFLVKNIEIEGISEDSKQSLIKSLPIKVGNRVNDADIAVLVKNLFVDPRFSNAQVKQKDENTLLINLTENPIIASIIVKGNKLIPKEGIKTTLEGNKLSQGEIFNKSRLDALCKEIEAHYHSMGRKNAVVTTNITPSDTGESVHIEINIVEDVITKVKETKFVGNTNFTEKKLVSLLSVKPNVSWWNLLESSKLEDNRMAMDKAKLEAFYKNNGFVKFNVEDVKVDISDDKKDATVTYYFNEGEQYHVGSVKFFGETADLDEQIAKKVKKFKVGDIYSVDELAELQGEIRDTLGEYGFALAQVNTQLVFDEDKKEVNVRFLIESGPRVYVRNIKFEGNLKTADKTMRREMRQQEGAWYSTVKLALGKARLERTGFYQSVEMQTVPVQGSPDKVDVIYKVVERPTGSFNIGAGYGTGTGFTFNAGVSQDNFLGLGTKVGLKAAYSKNNVNVALSYFDPYITKDGISSNSSLIYSFQMENTKDKENRYKRHSFVADTTFGFPFDEYNSYYAGIGLNYDEVHNISREYTRDKYMKGIGQITDGSKASKYAKLQTIDAILSAGWNYNSLDRGFFPRSGGRFNVNASTGLGTDLYVKFDGDFDYYLPFTKKKDWILRASGSVGFGTGFAKKELPFYKRYALGGIGSIRGFSTGTIGTPNIFWDGNQFSKYEKGSVVGGDLKANGTVALIVPLSFVSEKIANSLRLETFIDFGGVWDTKWNKDDPAINTVIDKHNLIDYKKSVAIRASAGIGLQWNSPIGPLLFSYAYPIKKEKNDIEQNFQFSIGGQF